MAKGTESKWPEKAQSGGQINETASGIRHTADSLDNFPRGTFVDYFGAPEHPKGKSPGRNNPMAPKRPGFFRGFWGEHVGKTAKEQGE